MSWISSILIALLSGGLGLVCGGAIMAKCVDWYRVSSFEGKAGFAVVGVALVGGIAGFVVGLIATRIVAAGPSPGLLKGVGAACGTVLLLALIALIVCRLRADLDPTLNGQPLELLIELRCPADFSLPAPSPDDDFRPSAGVYLPRGRRLPTAPVALDAATQTDGRWVLPATLPLTTSAKQKFLLVSLSPEQSLIFSLPLRPQPREADMQWSTWYESGWDVGTPKPPPEATFAVRYRVQIEAPPAPAPPDPAVPAAPATAE